MFFLKLHYNVCSINSRGHTSVQLRSTNEYKGIARTSSSLCNGSALYNKQVQTKSWEMMEPWLGDFWLQIWIAFEQKSSLQSTAGHKLSSCHSHIGYKFTNPLMECSTLWAEQSHQMRNCSQQQQMGWMNPFPLARKKSWIFFVHLDLDCTCKSQVNWSQAYFWEVCGIGFPELSWRVMSRLSLIMCWLLCYTTTTTTTTP